VATARAVFEGTAEGHGVAPPIHVYVPRVAPDAWTGRGTARLEIPSGDGVVAGRLEMAGLVFAVRGSRTGAHVSGALDEVVEASGAPTDPRPDAADPRDALFRGTLEGTLEGDTLHATWEASGGAGLHRREGTLEVHGAAH
jgi:hypothetical protein